MYFRDKVGEGLPDGEKPIQGKEEESWSRLVDRMKDNEWKQACLKRDEKYDMHFSAAVSLPP
jgi:cysteinyl-tRNA synthetase